jgi:hypothetical protein
MIEAISVMRTMNLLPWNEPAARELPCQGRTAP